MRTQIEFDIIIRAYLRLLTLGDYKDRHTPSAQSQLATMRTYIARICGESDQFVQELFELEAIQYNTTTHDFEQEISNILKHISPMRQSFANDNGESWFDTELN